jgi:electron transfer flavoprotein alpha/beta subunit
MRVAAVVELSWDPASIEVDPVTGGVDWARAAPAPAPGALEAVEHALRLGEATAYCVGAEAVEDLLRRCLAMGAPSVARAPDVRALAAALERARPDLVLTFHRSGDQGPSPLGPTLAGLLDWPQATGVDDLHVEAAEALVRRRLDRGERLELSLPLPAVVALEPGLVRPREATPAAMIAAQAAAVPALPPAPPAPAPILLGHQAPRPAPPRMPWPDARLSAEARIASVVGATAPARQRELVTGAPEEVAARIAEFLAELGYRPMRARSAEG